MARVGEILWRVLPAVRATERSRALFFTALLTLISAAQTVGLAGSEALLLARFGVARLPEIFIAASLLTVFGSTVYAARVGHTRNDRMFVQMLVGSAVALLAAAVAARAGSLGVLPALFCFFYLTQAVFLNHFFTFSGDYFDTLTSKRLFPVFVVGASIGGLLGGVAAAVATRLAGPISLIFGWAVLLAAAALLLRLARRALRRWGPLELEEADETSVEGMVGAARYLGATPIGRWLVASALGMVLAIFVAQYLYSEIFSRAYPDPADLAAFFGLYLAVTNLVEIALELQVTPWLIRRFGVPSSQLVHPLLMLLSFGGLLLRFGMAAGIGARVSRELVENAVAQPVRSLVYNALPQRLRGRIRAFLEGIVVYAGMSAAGVLLLLIGDPDPKALSIAGLSASILYLVANLRVRGEYLRELVEGIRTGRLDFGALGDEVGDLEAVQLAEICDQLLREETEGPSTSLLRLLPLLGRRGISAPLLSGARHAHPAVREASLHALASTSGEPGDEAPIHRALRDALGDPDPGVRLAAMRGLAARGAADDPALRPLLEDPDPRVRATAAARRGEEGLSALRAMLAGGDPLAVTAALRVAPSQLAAEITARVADPDPAVRAAALERAREVEVPRLPERALLEAAVAADARVRSAAVALLATRADGDLAPVADALADPSVEVRRNATAALAACSDRGIDAAIPLLQDDREPAVEAALRVIAEAAPPRRRRDMLRAAVRHHARETWQCQVAFLCIPPERDVAHDFLRAAIDDALLRHRRLAFRALALLESERIVARVGRALRSRARRTRADALEVVSHLGDRESAGLLVLLYEEAPVEERRAGAEAILGRIDGEALLRGARDSDSRWIRLAATAIAAPGLDSKETRTMERLLALKRVPLFANLTLDQLDAIHQVAEEATFVRGEVVMREGEPGNELFILLDGLLDVYLGWETPEQSRLREIRPVDYVGEMAILDDEPRSATIVAVESSRLLSLEGESLKDLILQMPEISFEIFRVLTQRVRTAERRLQHR